MLTIKGKTQIQKEKNCRSSTQLYIQSICGIKKMFFYSIIGYEGQELEDIMSLIHLFSKIRNNWL